MRMYLSALLCLVFMSGCDHPVDTVGLTATTNPNTGEIGAGVTISLKEAQKREAASAAQCARVARDDLRREFKANPCPQSKEQRAEYESKKKAFDRTISKSKVPLGERFSRFFSLCDPCCATTPYTPPQTPEQPPSPPSQQQPPAPQANNEDQAILDAILANGENEDATKGVKGGDDRAVVFGDNYPGTSAELNECVRDAKEDAINLVKIDKFDPKNIRLFLNEKCTAANYKKWMTWSLKDYNPGDRRVLLMNSSHGSEGVGPDGKIVDLLVTYDMVTQDWSDAHTVSYDWIYNLVHNTTARWVALNDSCHAGGQIKVLGLVGVTQKTRRVRSVAPPPLVQAQLDKATEKSNAKALVSQLSGTVFAACLPSELSEEDSRGGAGTRAYWDARKNIQSTKAGDIAREANRLLRERQFSQHMTILGQNKPLWTE